MTAVNETAYITDFITTTNSSNLLDCGLPAGQCVSINYLLINKKRSLNGFKAQNQRCDQYRFVKNSVAKQPNSNLIDKFKDLEH